LSVCGRNDFIVKVPNASKPSELTPGLEIPLGWRLEDCRALNIPSEE
jgi:putative spermidine/putrescine transport system ATP-binding protein